MTDKLLIDRVLLQELIDDVSDYAESRLFKKVEWNWRTELLEKARALLAAGASEADHPLDIRAYIVTDRSSGAKALKWAAELGNRFPSELYQLIPLTHHADAVAELTALRERIAGMEKDAERYRWLRGEGFDRPAHMWVTALPAGTPIVHSDLDAAIDGAIAKEKQG